MAAHRCSYSIVLLFLCSFSVFVVADRQELTPTRGSSAAAVDSPQTASETVEQTTEQPAVEEPQWEATEVEEATPDDAETDSRDMPAAETLIPQPKDDFQEELIIRPLHSGDVYASFQFRTLWETDFLRGNKGEQFTARSKHTVQISQK